MRSSGDLTRDYSCHCGAPRPVLRLALIAAIVTLLGGLFIAGVRMAAATALGDSIGGNAFRHKAAPTYVRRSAWKRTTRIGLHRATLHARESACNAEHGRETSV
jgi:hypothetical protein